jgi:dihydroorotase
MSVDLLIRNARIVSSAGVEDAHLLVEDGKIAGRVAHSENPAAKRTIDADGKLVIPGLVDAHAHFREPGAEHKEGFFSGSAAAVVGGVTTVLVMPTDNPATRTAGEYLAKAKMAEEVTHADFGLLALATPDLAHLPELAALGVLGMEFFLIGENAEALWDVDLLADLLRRTAARHLVCSITPGEDEITTRRTDALRRAGRRDPKAFAESRPSVAEAVAVEHACAAAYEADARVHVRQVSTAPAVDSLRFWRSVGARLSAEATPHNLALTDEELMRQGPFAKMAPPLRTKSDRDALARAAREDIITMVATDHAPHLASEKERGRADIWEAPLGVPGLQTMLPILLREVSRGSLSLGDIVRLASENPAKVFGLYPAKGALLPGSDADLVIVDPDVSFVIRSEDQISKAAHTLFDGTEVRGKPVLTVLRGREVAVDGKIVGDPGGKLLTRVR